MNTFAGCGQVWAVMKGPYGRTLALCWSEGREARIVDVNQPTCVRPTTHPLTHARFPLLAALTVALHAQASRTLLVVARCGR
jgi:hypothetical protein